MVCTAYHKPPLETLEFLSTVKGDLKLLKHLHWHRCWSSSPSFWSPARRPFFFNIQDQAHHNSVVSQLSWHVRLYCLSSIALEIVAQQPNSFLPVGFTISGDLKGIYTVSAPHRPSSSVLFISWCAHIHARFFLDSFVD